MSRGIGEFAPIQEHIPEWLAVVIALLTQLGDVWFLVALLVGLYWFHGSKREEVAVVSGLAFAGIGLYRGLKHVFGLPRPEQPLVEIAHLPWFVQPLYEATAHAGGYGFPSGHAFSTTVIYFGLASVLSVSTRRRRFGAAAAIVAVVCFTRVALGVHYLVDVVAGVILGAAFLLAAGALLDRRPVDQGTSAFGLAISLNSFYLLASDGVGGAILLLGVSLGAFAGWQLVVLGRQLVLAPRPSTALGPIAIRGGAAVAAGAPLIAALERFPILTPFAGGGLLGLWTALIVVVPMGRQSERVQRAWIAAVYWTGVAWLGVRLLLRRETWRRAGAIAHECAVIARDYGVRAREWLRARRSE